jgi:hypothetical protein
LDKPAFDARYHLLNYCSHQGRVSLVYLLLQRRQLASHLLDSGLEISRNFSRSFQGLQFGLQLLPLSTPFP